MLSSYYFELIGYVTEDWLKTLEPGLPVLGKTVLAINRPALGGLEGYFAFFTAVRTSCLVHFSWATEASPAAPKSTVSH